MTYIKKSQILIIIIGCIFVYILFNFWPWSSQTFTTNNQQYYRKSSPSDKGKIHKGKPSTATTVQTNKEDHRDVKKLINNIDVIITFSKAKDNRGLQQKFEVTVSSMFKWATVPLSLHIIGDDESKDLAGRILEGAASKYNATYMMVSLDVEHLAKELHEIVKEMQPYFSYSPEAYYSDALFFLSMALHKVLPLTITKVIMLDADLKFNADIVKLYEEFYKFSDDNVMAIARENQPVYRHTFSLYRTKHRGTRVGDPPPNGLTGFNSGVLLLDLDKMRSSGRYNSLLTASSVKSLTTEYSFQGHLGDQDFFSLVSMVHENLFYILPCTWNRQLCDWWRDKGYEDVFDLYFKCEGHINIYHGNCNTAIPVLDWEKN
ncbi:xyloside xylosyltransferase 1-like [Pecten maximus]|uniref:xyloside xylosyltransferase 1-like n=1 Tax=Pecten maximus TaxID=6579 RepID=UPI001458F6AC|nr:xyloside xylosyltransferase 1-like [Pecten maximus]